MKIARRRQCEAREFPGLQYCAHESDPAFRNDHDHWKILAIQTSIPLPLNHIAAGPLFERDPGD